MTTNEVFAEAPDEPLRVSKKNVLEPDCVLKPGFPVERSTGINRKAGPVGIAPAPDCKEFAFGGKSVKNEFGRNKWGRKRVDFR